MEKAKGSLCFRAEEPFLGVFACKYRSGYGVVKGALNLKLKPLLGVLSLSCMDSLDQSLTFWRCGEGTDINHTAQKIIIRIKIRQWLKKNVP